MKAQIVFAVLIGALVTAVIQSSSATSVIAISLVNAGAISFKNSIGIIFGANVGTTVTAQLVEYLVQPRNSQTIFRSCP